MVQKQQEPHPAKVASQTQFPHACHYQDTDANHRQVQHTLCYDEPHAEEEVCGRQEWHNTHGQPHQHKSENKFTENATIMS